MLGKASKWSEFPRRPTRFRHNWQDVRSELLLLRSRQHLEHSAKPGVIPWNRDSTPICGFNELPEGVGLCDHLFFPRGLWPRLQTGIGPRSAGLLVKPQGRGHQRPRLPLPSKQPPARSEEKLGSRSESLQERSCRLVELRGRGPLRHASTLHGRAPTTPADPYRHHESSRWSPAAPSSTPPLWSPNRPISSPDDSGAVRGVPPMTTPPRSSRSRSSIRSARSSSSTAPRRSRRPRPPRSRGAGPALTRNASAADNQAVDTSNSHPATLDLGLILDHMVRLAQGNVDIGSSGECGASREDSTSGPHR